MKFFREDPTIPEHKKSADESMRELMQTHTSVYGLEWRKAPDEEEARRRLKLLSAADDDILGLKIG